MLFDRIITELHSTRGNLCLVILASLIWEVCNISSVLLNLVSLVYVLDRDRKRWFMPQWKFNKFLNFTCYRYPLQFLDISAEIILQEWFPFKLCLSGYI